MLAEFVSKIGFLESAYLVVKRFDALYRDFSQKPIFNKPIYALPLYDTDRNPNRIHYHGLDRDPITAWDNPKALLAQIRMAEIGEVPDYVGCFLLSSEDMLDVLKWAEAEIPGVYEPVWARLAGSGLIPPTVYRMIGYEPSYFPFGFFSPSCDCMCFPRWHGTDPEGVLFSEHFRRLNDYGLFDSFKDANDFLTYYQSFDWTEKVGDYQIIEVWIPDMNQLEK